MRQLRTRRQAESKRAIKALKKPGMKKESEIEDQILCLLYHLLSHVFTQEDDFRHTQGLANAVR